MFLVFHEAKDGPYEVQLLEFKRVLRLLRGKALHMQLERLNVDRSDQLGVLEAALKVELIFS